MYQDEDLKLFEIIYAQHKDKPMTFIQEELLKAKKALIENNAKLEAEKLEAEKNQKTEEKKEISFVELKKSDLIIKNRAEIDEAIGENGITCCICGKTKQTLGKHLKRVHHVDPKEYIRVCGYPENTALMGKKLLEKAQANARKAQSMRKCCLPKN